MPDPVPAWPSTGPDDPLHRAKHRKAIRRAYEACVALANTDVKISRGHTPVVTVGGKNFAIFWRGDARPSVCLNVPPGAQGVLAKADPERYFVPAYMGVRGWIGVRLDNDVDWETLERLIDESHAHAAPPPKAAKRRR
jgi:predicted DNA-binding protein (MmcQ/YjbR family)